MRQRSLDDKARVDEARSVLHETQQELDKSRARLKYAKELHTKELSAKSEEVSTKI